MAAKDLASPDSAAHTALRAAPAFLCTYLGVRSEQEKHGRSFTHLSLSPGRGMAAWPWQTSYLSCTGPTELVITILLNKLAMREAQDTPRTSVHVGNIYLPLSFLQALTGARPWSRFHRQEAPVNTLITNFTRGGNLPTPWNR